MIEKSSRMKKKLKVRLSLNKPILLEDIANEAELNTKELRFQLENALREHYFHFGSKPFSIEYSPALGDILRASSSVGKLSAENLVIEIHPKLPGLEIGKCLGLAQYGGHGLLKMNNSSIINEYFSENENYSSIDFVAFSFLDAVLTVKNNGFARKFIEVFGTSSKLKGEISFQKTISEGRSFLQSIVKNIEPTIDIIPNQILKYALTLCAKKSSFEDIKRLSQTYLTFFDDVSLIEEPSLFVEMLSFQQNLPRPDYEKAFAFAKAIIEGRSLSEESEEDLLVPSFTLDLDKVFEGYCSFQMKEILSSQHYSALIQHPFPHRMDPDIVKKSIYPDIVVHNKGTGQKVILDIKNKYSALRENGELAISNEDLYQITYYASTLECKTCILIYPGLNPKFQYPIKISEGASAYRKKVKKSVLELKSKNSITVFGQEGIKIIPYIIDLKGSLRNTKKSVASLCQLVADITNPESIYQTI